MTQKTFFIIPGFKEQANNKSYAWIFKFLKSKNYKAVPVPVDWNYKTLSDNKVELLNFFKKISRWRELSHWFFLRSGFGNVNCQ